MLFQTKKKSLSFLILCALFLFYFVDLIKLRMLEKHSLVLYSIEIFSIFLFIIAFFKLKDSNCEVREKIKIINCNDYDPLLTLRAFACLMVLLGHGFLIQFKPDSLNQDINYLWLISSSPWSGVWVFFTLSGYLMGKGFYTARYQANYDDIKQFFCNRFLRIFPLYLTAVIIVSALTTPYIFEKKYLWILAKILLFNYQGNLPINPIGALWTVSTEVGFYLMVPFIFILLNEFSRKKNVAIGLISLFFFIGLVYRINMWFSFGGLSAWVDYIYKPLLSNIDMFLIGFLINPIIMKTKKIKKGIIFGLGSMVILYLITSFMGSRAMVLNREKWQFILFALMPSFITILTASIIGIFELSEKIENEKINFLLKKTQIIGTLTYAIYVWHGPIFDYWMHRFKNHGYLLKSFMHFSIALASTTIISYYSYKFVESRFYKNFSSQKIPSNIN